MSVFYVLTLAACTLDEVTDPNAPDVNDVTTGDILNRINELAVGVESTMRNGIGVETTSSGTMARELYLFDADPRNTGDLLGKNGASLDNNSFYSTTQWTGNYTSIKSANLLIEAATNSPVATEEQKQGYFGFAKTIQAYEFIQILKSYGEARLDVADLNNLGELVDNPEVILERVRKLLDEGLDHLNQAGDAFSFTLSSGFEGFDTPETFARFNRAILAITEVYDKNGMEALMALEDSFFGLNESFDLGPKHVFGLGSGDLANPLFKVPSLSETQSNNSDQIIVHNSWIEDAEEGDTRIRMKAAVRPDTIAQDDLNGTHETRLYSSNISPIDIIRNEELILVYAEANILVSNFDEAIRALNIIRNAFELPNYSGMSTSEALVDELLNQRRYSLWLENHRMYDLRRYNRSDQLSLDREGDQIFNVLPIPLAENLDR